jgi:hypothetical protein
MSNVIKFPGDTLEDLDAATMLRNIADSEPQNAFVILWPSDGSIPTYHSTTSDIPVVMLRIQGFIHKVYNGDFGDV